MNRVELSINGHGGECCGISHVHDFPLSSYFSSTLSAEEKANAIQHAVDKAVEETKDRYEHPKQDHRHAIEVVLNEGQLHEWRKSLEESGFREVFEFHNDNSGNRCYVFFMQTGEQS
jgi:hypothetical protein